MFGAYCYALMLAIQVASLAGYCKLTSQSCSNLYYCYCFYYTQQALLKRLPLKRTASLVNALMARHILVQSAYQLALLSWLLLRGATAYGVADGSAQHFTIIFNAFVFCQIFNEFNARSIGNSWSVLSGLTTNPMFQGVIAFTVAAQWSIVQYGGDFTKVRRNTLY
jgi:P-type Ca2+ transporter type 2C